MNGSCRFGDSCFNSHDVTTLRPRPTSSLTDNTNHNRISVSSSESATNNTASICKYFLEGRCVFGDNCFNQHIIPQQHYSSAELTNSSNDSISDHNNQDNHTETPVVRRISNKPKLVTSITYTQNDGYNMVPENNQEVNHQFTPTSYYEALTGKKLNLQNLNDSDLSMFDETYRDYLRQKASLVLLESDTSAGAQSLPPLCPYFEKQLECPFGEYCEYIHGDFCEICQTPCLHPHSEEQRQAHRKECMSLIEKDMQEAFAVQCSKDKACGICMETVWEKENGDKRFGILENCNHIYCLDCIRKWRASKVYENKIVKACPECRVKSDYVTPSKYWYESEDDKKKIIHDYKSNLG